MQFHVLGTDLRKWHIPRILDGDFVLKIQDFFENLTNLLKISKIFELQNSENLKKLKKDPIYFMSKHRL